MWRFTAGGAAAAVIAACAGFAVWNEMWVEYEPIVWGGRGYVTASELDSEEHREAVVVVLGNYGQQVRTRDGTVFIKRRLARDRDLLMNFTSKAEDRRRVGSRR